MKFTVVWHEQPQAQLAAAWLSAADRNKISSAAAHIDSVLAADPVRAGSGIHEGIRELLAPPLAVLYSVRESDRLVEVELLKLVNG